MKKLVTLLLLAGLAGGCASSPGPNLFTLNMEPSAEAGSPVNLTVGRLRIAEALHSKRILIKKSPTEIEYYAAAEWAAGLDELLAEKLGAEFGPAGPARPTFVISGVLLAFEQVDTPGGAQAHVKLQLDIRKDGASYYSAPELSKAYEVRRPAKSGTSGGIVEALSECLEQVAREIVTDASGISNGQ